MARFGYGGLLLVILLVQWPLAGHAHKMAPLLIDVDFQPLGLVTIQWRRPVASGANIQLELPAQCSPLALPRQRVEGGALDETLQLRCGGEGFFVALRGLAEARNIALLRWQPLDGGAQQTVLTVDRPGRNLLAADAHTANEGLLWFGLKHIAQGADHLLFVLGLFLITAGWRQRIVLITAFTLGHSVSLLLSALGVVLLWLPLVELCIALSVLGLALGIPAGLARTPPHYRWYPLVITAVGFLHGLGFASALREIGLSEHGLVLAVLLFNLGVELGQIGFVAILALIFAVVVRLDGLWPRAALHRRVRGVIILGMGGLAMFWVAERAWETASAMQLL
ncbi:MAG: HupE/UreJ family protein [Spongiibacter sp.]|nr:HupE/UreJ family protein [Spongiibacter sp.]